MSELIEGPAGDIEVRVRGDGPTVVLLPSLGRGAADFDDLATRVAAAGHRAIAPEPRGIGGSGGDLHGLSMFDLAADVAAVIIAMDAAPATLIGHAFGNRVARMTATEHPELVESLVLLACGGAVPPAPEHAVALRRVFDTEVTDAEHLAAVDTAFFAPGNDASVWVDGWYGDVAQHQGKATSALDPEHWLDAGDADVLVVQPLDDVVALPANAESILRRIGERASYAEIADAGHALLPEQPDAVAEVVLGWLDTRQR